MDINQITPEYLAEEYEKLQKGTFFYDIYGQYNEFLAK